MTRTDMASYIFEQDGMILAQSPAWEFDEYGFLPNGIGDAIWRTALALILYGDVRLAISIIYCLSQGIRWKDSLNPAPPYPKKYQGARSAYRSQKSMTRDPYTMGIVSLYIRGYHGYLKAIRVPLRLMTPSYYYWVKLMQAKATFSADPVKIARLKASYEWWDMMDMRISRWSQRMSDYAMKRSWKWIAMKLFQPMYPKHLSAWMAYVADSDKIKKELLQVTPEWNYLVRALCGDEFSILDMERIKNYKARKGYQWQMEEWHPEDYLDAGEPMSIDKDILHWAVANQKAA